MRSNEIPNTARNAILCDDGGGTTTLHLEAVAAEKLEVYDYHPEFILWLDRNAQQKLRGVHKDIVPRSLDLRKALSKNEIVLPTSTPYTQQSNVLAKRAN